MKKRIVIQDQPSLSWRRTLRITLDGIRYRLFRATVTVAVIAVAVAFLMNILSESLIKRRVAAVSRARLAERTLVHAWAARLTEPPSLRTCIAALANPDPAAAPLRAEMLAMGGLAAAPSADTSAAPPPAAEALVAYCREAERILAAFEALDYARRRSLVHTATGTAIFDHLQAPDAMAAMRAALRDLRSIRLPVSADALDAFLRAWPDRQPALLAIHTGYANAIARLEAARARRPILETLADAQPAFAAAARDAGFAFDAATAARVTAEARQVLDSVRVEHSLDDPAARRALAGRYRVLPRDVGPALLWAPLATPDGAAWYRAQLAADPAAAPLPEPPRLVELALARHTDELLSRAKARTADVGAGWLGLGPRMSWLLLVSMLVCAIGIANAMLMTVTERFREIATMKCLGALDHIIMLMFTLESCVFGLVGGLVGALLGSAIGIGRMAAQFGGALSGALPVQELLLGALAAVCCGIGLAAIAAVYPSFKAARLAPMEAMRTE